LLHRRQQKLKVSKEIADSDMKLDNRDDALEVAYHLVNATIEQIANALIEAHLEGIRQGRSVLLQGRSVDQALDELDERRRFLLKEMSTK